MKNVIKKIIKRLLYRNKCDSKHYIKYLRSKGVKVGDDTYFFSPRSTYVDTANGIFIEIGEKCKITKGVNILAHDYSYSVLRPVYHDIPKKAGKTVIGNNVFIGINSIILLNAKIGNNVIIGAGSVVSGEIPDNEVWGGNPARFICTLKEYYEKCKKRFEENAVIVLKEFNNKKHRDPSIQEMQYFSLLFLNDEEKEMSISRMLFNGDDKKEVLDDCMNIKNKYKSYEEFKSKNI
ncbi:MAG: acyltransferase [Bacilli bacterium]|nr:acyltransferase [Bacilli bacterium]